MFGPMPEESYNEGVAAAHEAGHVVVNYVQGFYPAYADIIQTEGQFGITYNNTAQRRPLRLDMNFRELELLGQSWLAGFLGEWVLFRYQNRYPFSSLEEVAMVTTLSAWIANNTGETYKVIYERIHDRTQFLLEKNNPTLWAIYHALMKQKSVSGPQLQAMLRSISFENLR
jgi:hypothetical protein